jgi:hypothetical protein
MIQADNKTYIIHTGDKMLDGAVKASRHPVVFAQDVNDPLCSSSAKVRVAARAEEERCGSPATCSFIFSAWLAARSSLRWCVGPLVSPGPDAISDAVVIEASNWWRIGQPPDPLTVLAELRNVDVEGPRSGCRLRASCSASISNLPWPRREPRRARPPGAGASSVRCAAGAHHRPLRAGARRQSVHRGVRRPARVVGSGRSVSPQAAEATGVRPRS